MLLDDSVRALRPRAAGRHARRTSTSGPTCRTCFRCSRCCRRRSRPWPTSSRFIGEHARRAPRSPRCSTGGRRARCRSPRSVGQPVRRRNCAADSQRAIGVRQHACVRPGTRASGADTPAASPRRSRPASAACRRRESCSSISSLTDLHQHGRQSAQVAVDRRREAVAGIAPRQVEPRALLDPRQRHHDFAARRRPAVRLAQIHPRREQHQRRRPGLTQFPQAQRRGERQATARGIACQRQLLRGMPAATQAAIRRHRVVDALRETDAPGPAGNRQRRPGRTRSRARCVVMERCVAGEPTQ